MNKKYFIGICILVLVFLLGLIVWEKIRNTHQMGISKSSERHREVLPKEIDILLNQNGFTPNQVTIKVGTAVRWKNESGSQETVNSDNYPTNQLHRELNFGVFNNNSSVVFTFMKPGIYGYHNEFHHKQEGKIIVTE
jgi:plastocyanin